MLNESEIALMGMAELAVKNDSNFLTQPTAVLALLRDLDGARFGAESHLKTIKSQQAIIANYAADRHKVAFDEWIEKTNWVQEQQDSFPFNALGIHRADTIRHEIERLRNIVQSSDLSKLRDEGWITTDIDAPTLIVKLLTIIGNAYQIAGAHNAPEHILDVLSDPESAMDDQIDAMLPYVVAEASVAIHTQPQAAIPVRTDLYLAAIRCAHEIDAESVTLYRDPAKKGNALSQLGARAVPGSIGDDPQFMQLMKELRGCAVNTIEDRHSEIVAYIGTFFQRGK